MYVMEVIGTLVAIDIALRLITWAYYADEERVLQILNLLPRSMGPRMPYYKRFDAVLAPLPFLWTWIEIFLMVWLANYFDHAIVWGLAIVIIGGRFRALQEFGHNAVHFALCKSHAWQWFLSDYFYQFPAFKRDMHSRHVTHTREHHKNPNHMSLDPNRARVRDGGMAYPLTERQFYARLLYPLTPRGLRVNITTMLRNSMLNHSKTTTVIRCICLLQLALTFFVLAGWKGVVLGWFAPLFTTYALFAWLALLAEHRWFVSGSFENRRELEYLAGRPTDYSGFSGWMVRILVSPTSDAFHLAHSLYPGVRWNYLPAIDRILKITDSRYTAHASEGLIFSKHGAPSALSELRDRLVIRELEQHSSGVQGVGG
ncbi:dihydrorhizobitoxine desaturase [Dyella monticola]|uniref:Dihydrorhizobitoxine desaturase n=2 Tax=Dyella monticola TaxID=1927958 RepID=A0A370X6A1_9GAMM|nr:dihydrorhizobitoxine desaturase [Dyella monticola]